LGGAEDFDGLPARDGIGESFFGSGRWGQAFGSESGVKFNAGFGDAASMVGASDHDVMEAQKNFSFLEMEADAAMPVGHVGFADLTFVGGFAEGEDFVHLEAKIFLERIARRAFVGDKDGRAVEERADHGLADGGGENIVRAGAQLGVDFDGIARSMLVKEAVAEGGIHFLPGDVDGAVELVVLAEMFGTNGQFAKLNAEDIGGIDLAEGDESTQCVVVGGGSLLVQGFAEKSKGLLRRPRLDYFHDNFQHKISIGQTGGFAGKKDGEREGT
jgi:hypothetical protein